MRPVPIALLALALTPLVVAPPCAAAGGVALQEQGGAKPTVVPSEQIQALADVPATRYRIRDEPGRRARTLTRSGTRLVTVLSAAGVDPASVPTLEITRADGTILYLPRHLVDPPAGAPPLLYVTGGSVGFVRDSLGSDDLNATDAFVSSSGTPIRITVSPAAVLSVQVRAGETRIEPGGRVRFAADVAGALPGERLSYEWRFGDGRTARTAEPTHHFAHRGRYEVVLQVTGDRRSGGSSTPVTVQVGVPVETAAERDGAGRSRSESGPASGPVSGPRSGGGAAGSPTGRAPQASSRHRRHQPSGAQRVARGEAAARHERARREAAPARKRGGEGPPLLTGAVLGESAAPVARKAASAAQAAARAGSTRSDPPLGWAAGALTCLLLLALGAGAEWRALTRRRARVLGAGR